MKTKSLLTLFLALLSLLSCTSGNSSLFTDSTDVGNVSYSGTLSYDKQSDTYTISGAGVNCWGPSDAFFFVWKEISGDFEISADFAFEGEGVNPHRKVGFMIRESLDPDSRYADVALHGEGLTSLQYRSEKGGETAESVPDVWAPTTLAFSRTGNTIAFRSGKGSLPSSDDTSIEMEFPKTCYVCFFMCSHEEDVIETGYISNLKLKN